MENLLTDDGFAKAKVDHLGDGKVEELSQASDKRDMHRTFPIFEISEEYLKNALCDDLIYRKSEELHRNFIKEHFKIEDLF